MADPLTFNQTLFDVCPTGMLALDHNLSIRWLNPALEKMLDLSGSELIGRSKDNLPQELHALFDETDILHLAMNDSVERWLRRDVREVFDGNNALRLYFYQDISPQILARQECDLLRRQVEKLTITDELTGLANRRAVLQALATQVTRSRRYGNLLTLGAVQIDYPGEPAQRLPDASILNFSHYLRERLRWSDTIGRYEDQLFLLVMPETPESDALRLLEQIRQECHEGAVTELPSEAPVPSVKATASSWIKGDDPGRLVKRTLELLDSRSSH
ncbi:MAG: diguanylate cyclase [Chromatiales bacterium]|jgi:diguanylate cyclase (GGDEF)-like protein